ncbi:TIGR03936 family radical SAM-associated protein [Clostridium sp. 'White wine YQ']|uniref:TIGR03936 family radical SAM-associated protein n=1 Tax=Clostridium sp. 'White wine YQ' TaxID=3027474 RepID=UPI002365FF33|nr:TIGR03936 family radical SAM-associated protein [Clostridium sp. 'White wine YQ']MDD7794874.1 TIGR03936 family radical SAM-associated protein [Clostridium sp. 'White wine YQ']
MRYLIKFTKEGNIKFVSHLDLMRTIQKIIVRSELNIEYSQGFNPHMALSIAQPLSVGVSSNGEYMDIVLREPQDEEEILRNLNKKSLSGIKFLEIKSIENIPNEKKVPQSMAMVEEASYTIKIKYDVTTNVNDELKKLLELNEWNILKKNKKGEEKSLNIRPMIKEIKYWVKDEYLIINTRISCGSKEHLNPEFLVNYIKENTTGVDNEAFVNINREEMYAHKEGKLLPLYKVV